MLFLKNIKKSYDCGGFKVNALDDVSLAFRQSEFVSILGPSGSGKTTLLNIIGGLDHYTTGDLIINGKSTKQFNDRDWDTYRNHSIGFVFQSYNLIPHQSVLSNVELALTLSGVSRKERRKRAAQVLERVGLANQLHKKPSQMSGGQMQRVAIARALVNDPDILLADEPTGALDSVTSVQIMELLKEVSRDRLVVMVTHNPELAEQYSSRIVRLRDGKIVDDTNPFDGKEEVRDVAKTKKTSMSFLTALTLSLNNLMTKKARTILTSFAGSIGIIGIALILSLSSGIKAYINQVQEETLSSYPIEIQAEQIDMSSLITGIMGAKDKSTSHDHDRVYASSVMYELTNTFNSAETNHNDLKSLKEYFESDSSSIKEYATDIQYLYDIKPNIYAKTAEGEYQKADIMEVFMQMGTADSSSTSSMSTMFSSFSTYSTWAEILPGENGAGVSDVITSQYEVIGAWPESKNDILLVLDSNNEITDITLHALGLKTTESIIKNMMAARNGEEVTLEVESYGYDEIIGRQFKLICSPEYYVDTDNDGVWEDISDNKDSMDVVISNGLELRICGIARPLSDTSSALTAPLYYTHELTEYVINKTNEYPISVQQKADENTDVFTGLPFVLEEESDKTDAQLAEEMRTYFATLNDSAKREVYLKMLSVPDKAYLEATVEAYMAQFPDRDSLEEMIFSEYAKSAGLDEDSIKSFIEGYNDDELFALVKEQIVNMICEQTREQAENAIDEIMSAPTAEELQPYKAQLLAQFTDKNTKIGYIMSKYVDSTSMPQQTVMGYLMTLSDAQIDEKLELLITEEATKLYKQYSAGGTDAESLNKKVAVAFDAYVATLTDEQLAYMYDDCMPPKTSSSTYKDNLSLLGVADLASPTRICIYAATFADKDEIADIITDYNNSVEEEKQISYTDYVALIMSSVTTIIDVISYVLIAFVSISLVVSSIMIGIITYISVLERTKEIGILRAIGASKRDVTNVFNAETLIVGFVSGAIGIIATVLLCIPINLIVRSLTGIESLTAYLPLFGGIALMLISMFLTFIAGLLPSLLAASKDPVVALRSE